MSLFDVRRAQAELPSQEETLATRDAERLRGIQQQVTATDFSSGLFKGVLGAQAAKQEDKASDEKSKRMEMLRQALKIEEQRLAQAEYDKATAQAFEKARGSIDEFAGMSISKNDPKYIVRALNGDAPEIVNYAKYKFGQEYASARANAENGVDILDAQGNVIDRFAISDLTGIVSKETLQVQKDARALRQQDLGTETYEAVFERAGKDVTIQFKVDQDTGQPVDFFGRPITDMIKTAPVKAASRQVNITQENQLTKAVLDADLPRIKRTLDAAAKVFENNAQLEIIRQAHERGAATGPLAVPAIFTQNLANQLGIELDLEGVQDAEILRNQADRLVLDRIKDLGSNPSNADRDFLRGAVASVGASPAANAAYIDSQLQLNNRLQAHGAIIREVEARNGTNAELQQRLAEYDRANPFIVKSPQTVMEELGISETRSIINNEPTQNAQDAKDILRKLREQGAIK